MCIAGVFNVLILIDPFNSKTLNMVLLEFADLVLAC